MDTDHDTSQTLDTNLERQKLILVTPAAQKNEIAYHLKPIYNDKRRQ